MSWPEDEPRPAERSRPTGKRPARWGLRTLGFLALGMLAIITAAGLGYSTWGTLGCTIIGVVGAGYCSYRGLRQMLTLNRRDLP